MLLPMTVDALPAQIAQRREVRLSATRSLVVVQWEDTDCGVSVLLKESGRILSATSATGLGFTEGAQTDDDPPRVVRFGRNRFLTLWSGTGDTMYKDFFLIDGRTLRHVGAFEEAWSPRFGQTGVVLEYPWQESMTEMRLRG